MTITEDIRAIVERAERERLEKLREIELERVFLRVRIRGYDADREKLASLDAEYARLESRTGADIVREAMGETKPAPTEDPFVPGLPPLRLREVWGEWETSDGRIYEFAGELVRGRHWREDEKPDAIEHGAWTVRKLRPHGKTRAEVEAMADAREGQTAEKPEPPALLDLRTLKVGDRLVVGQKVRVAGVSITEKDGSTWTVTPCVPARVVEVPR